mmetsp:Transcript_54643/g.162643  ORF Transcript_54643/g.162643 Transcript_54643/m.162643 type:complete len:203 (-) Transcript_54643:257-865(-)
MTCSPLSPARKWSCNTDLSGQITRRTQDSYTLFERSSARSFLSALSKVQCAPPQPAGFAPVAGTFSAMPPSSTTSSSRRPAPSQKTVGRSSTCGADSTLRSSSCWSLLTSSLTWSASAHSALLPLERKGLKPFPGRGGTAMPACCAALARVWCASVSRARYATGIDSMGPPLWPSSTSMASTSTKPQPRRKSRPAAWRPSFW